MLSEPSLGINKLPLELFESIIDHLHDDSLSLKACSTVSRNWLDASRNHLFHKMTVPCAREHAAKSTHILNFFNNCRAIFTYVREAYITYGHTSSFWVLEPDALAVSVLLELLYALPSLRCVTLDCVVLRSSVEKPQQYRPLVLHRLVIIEGTVDTEAWLTLTASISSIYSLHFRNRVKIGRSGGPYPSSYPFPEVRHLNIDQLPMDDKPKSVATFLPYRRIASSGTLASLSLGFFFGGMLPEAVRELMGILNHFGDQLTHLSLDFALAVPSAGLDLSSFTSLRSLTVCIYTGTRPISDDDIHSNWSSLSVTLASIRVPLETVTVEVTEENGLNECLIPPDFVEQVAWKMVDEAMSSMPGTPMVVFRGRGTRKERASLEEVKFPLLPVFRDILQSSLPALHASGRLAFFRE